MAIDQYGNDKEGDRLIHCSFPDCGCDGARLCMAENGASERAISQNVEGMWTVNSVKNKSAIMKLVASVERK